MLTVVKGLDAHRIDYAKKLKTQFSIERNGESYWITIGYIDLRERNAPFLNLMR